MSSGEGVSNVGGLFFVSLEHIASTACVQVWMQLARARGTVGKSL